MNIYFSSNNRAIVIFTITWLVLSIVVSFVFSFILFPDIYAERIGAKVQIYFVTKDPSSGEVKYWPNTNEWRSEQLKNLTDNTHLFFPACSVLPLSQRPKCDANSNWQVIDKNELSYTDVTGCFKETAILSDTARQRAVSRLVPVSGATISLSDLPPLSLSDPIAWGQAARWPLFFFCLFLALKLGRSSGEFIFTTYEKK